MKKVRAIRVYADTSVFGGVFDDAFKKAGAQFFEHVKSRDLQLVISPLVETELRRAPGNVRDFFSEIKEYAELIVPGPDVLVLQKAYIKAEIITANWEEDALHVALATVSDCAIIVSWNFKHIVNYRRIPLYNAVNMAHGYRPIAIYSPMEVITDEK